MSMLAERKRKQKWSLNPRGKHWSEDSNKFGQKLMEKMGWSAGKGLGAKEDGITEHIRVYHKNDSKGMGYKETDDQWTQHESNFSQLLNSLSGPKENGNTEKENEYKLESLEKKSQNSRARVHYHKFTRGKDLSRYSEKDLANIFGKKSLKEDKSIKHEIATQEDNENCTSKTFGVETQNRGSMLDYFKKKMSTRRYNIDSEIKSTTDRYESEEERSSFGFGFNVEGNENKVKSTFVSYIEENVLDNGVQEAEFEREKPLKKIGKLKSIQEEIEENRDQTVELPLKNNQKRKFDNKLELAFTPLKKKFKNFESLNSLQGEEEIEITPTKKCKKKKSKKEFEVNGLKNPAFDPTFNGVTNEKHLLEVIKEEDEDFKEESPMKTLNKCEGIEQAPSKKGKKRKKKFGEKSSQLACEGFVSTNNEVSVEKCPLEVIEEEVELEEEISLKKVKSKKKKSKAKEGIDNSCFVDFTEELSFISIEKHSHIDESIFSSNDEPKTKLKKSIKKKKIEECGIDNSAFNENFEDSRDITKVSESFEVSKKSRKRKSEIIEDDVYYSNIYNDGEKINRKKKDGKNKNREDSTPVIQGSNENVEDFRQNASKTKKRKKDQLVAMENPGFDPNESTECLENKTSFYEVKRNKKDVNLGIVNPGLDLTTPSPKRKKGKEVKPPLQLEMPVMDEEVMLNVVNTSVLKKKEEETSAQRRKSVRFSGVNQRIFINNTDSPADLRKNGSEGLDNEAYDELGNHIEENIDTLSKQLDDYQAEVENDINEAKLEVMVGEMGDPNGENQILADGDVKLKFKYAHFGKTPPWLKRNGDVNAKTSYRHLIKGDIVLGFKNTNLHEIKGYGKIKQGDMVEKYVRS